MGQFDHMQDVVGQLPFLKTYSHLLLAFPLQDDKATREEAKHRLHAASLRLAEAFPWLAAKVVQRSNGPGRSDSFHLEVCALWSTPNSIIRFRDYTSDNTMPSYQELVKARGPASMLPGGLLAPRKAFPESYCETDKDPAPVLALQANFIPGGLLLDCAAQHNFIDMSGIEQCYNLLAAALRGERFSDEAIAQGNVDRRNLVPLLQEQEQEPGALLLDHRQFLRPGPDSLPPTPAEPESPFSWCYFRFSAAKLAVLKAMAAAAPPPPTTETNPPSSLPSSPSPSAPPQSHPISTNDALTAFCWQRVIAARLARRRTPSAPAKLCRAVDARRALGVPRGYMGDLVTIATSSTTFGALAAAPLADVAARLRRDLAAVSTRAYARRFATWIAATPDKGVIAYGGAFDPDMDVGCSSWAHVGLAGVGFGPLLGRPGLVRRPDFGPLKSDIYFMPRTEGGDVDALVCFNQADLDGLRGDETWAAFAEHIG